MYIPKKYGSYKVDLCPFCKKQAVTKNSQEVPVCLSHKEAYLPDLKCACSRYLYMREGKFGIFFNCMNCGNVSLSKALSMNPNPEIKNNNKHFSKEKKEVTVTSDNVDVYYS